MIKWRTYELVPMHCNVKSFYGKAVVREYAGIYILSSYGTPVLRLNEDMSMNRLWDGWSTTTQRHINEFLDQFGVEHGGKDWWINLPVVM